MTEKNILNFDPSGFHIGLKNLNEEDGINSMEALLAESEEKLMEAENPGLLAAVCNEQGAFYRSVGNYPASLAAFRRAQKLIAERTGVHSMEYAALLNNIAGTCRLAGQREEAVKMYEEALSIYEQSAEQDDSARARIHNNLATVFNESGSIERAIHHLEKAVSLYRKMPGCEKETALAWCNLTTLHDQSGESEQAMECLERALAVFDGLLEKKNKHYVEALNSLAGFLHSRKMHSRAIHIYRRAVEYAEHNFGKCEQYAITCQNLYWVYRQTGKMESAAIALMNAVEAYRKNFGEENERTCAAREELERFIGCKVG